VIFTTPSLADESIYYVYIILLADEKKDDEKKRGVAIYNISKYDITITRIVFF
jgi:hypothetical protein